MTAGKLILRGGGKKIKTGASEYIDEMHFFPFLLSNKYDLRVHTDSSNTWAKYKVKLLFLKYDMPVK